MTLFKTNAAAPLGNIEERINDRMCKDGSEEKHSFVYQYDKGIHFTKCKEGLARGFFSTDDERTYHARGGSPIRISFICKLTEKNGITKIKGIVFPSLWFLIMFYLLMPFETLFTAIEGRIDGTLIFASVSLIYIYSVSKNIIEAKKRLIRFFETA